MNIQKLLNELTAEDDLLQKTPDWNKIHERVCELMPHINPEFIRYQLRNYIDRFY